MPWIAVTPSRPMAAPAATQLADAVAAGAACALGLGVGEVIVLVHAVAGASGRGAIAQVIGRDRGPAAEQALAAAVRDAIATALDLPADLVGLVRLP